MVRFSCFPTPIHYHRPKKTAEQTGGEMQTNSQEQAVKISIGSAISFPLPSKAEDHNLSNASAEQITSPSSYEGCWKSEDLSGNSCPEDNKEILQMMHLRKSQSLGSILDKERGFSCGDVMEDDETYQEFSFGNSQDKNLNVAIDAFANTGSSELHNHGDCTINIHDQHQEHDVSESFDVIADPVHHGSLFSIGVLKQFDGELYDGAGEQFSFEHVVDIRHSTSETPPVFEKSRSAPNVSFYTANTEGTLSHELMRTRSRSFEDLCSFNGRRAELLNGDEALRSGLAIQRYAAVSYSQNMPFAPDLIGKRLACQANSGKGCLLSYPVGECIEMANQERDGIYQRKKFEFENQSGDGYDYHSYNDLVNNWREPGMDGVDIRKKLQQESSTQNWDELTFKDFNIQRIEEWISQIDFQHGNPVQELGESSRSVPKKDSHVAVGVSPAKLNARSSPRMEVAYNYIKSLTATSSSAQMANLGLVVIPFLSPFLSLRVLNLSGNTIVWIAAGALPRGLHILNLSRNSISAIEGLRDLTRLRVLDLSYNRLFRIGHGLASCSSLKELYLAGNKISEVEGLHRLLKLTVLDLRVNKISTEKCLGQLAANYGSLQAINLEGNPAQRNVGDEQLKRYLSSLLPRLIYFNKQTIRANSSKEVSDRSSRSIITQRFDRGMRSENKHSRRGSCKSTASSSHSQSGHVVASSLKQSKNWHGRLPPIGTKKTHHLPNLDSKLFSSRPINSIQRSRSEGTL